MSTFQNFPKLPKELRDLVWRKSKPTTTTIEFSEDEYQVTYISPPPTHLITSKEARATALSWNLVKYPIWGPEDWEDMYLDPEEMIVEMIIQPSKSASLNITWTDIYSVLGDALLAAKQLHIVCSQPERLARLYMLPEADYVGVGQSCVEKGLFNDGESVSGDRKTREALQARLTVTASKHTVEEINKGIFHEVDVWKMVDEEISHHFGPEARIFTTKAFARVEVDRSSQMAVKQLHSVAKTSAALPVRETGEEEGREEIGAEREREEEEVEWSGVELTEDALTRHLEEWEKLYPKTAYEGDKEDPGGSIWPEYD
jgi:hypothetical protein